MKRLWIPGWQCSANAFTPLWQALSYSDERALDYADEQGAFTDWLDEQAAMITEPTHLLGWSLGGMLAFEIAKRSERVERVSILNANVRFSGGPGLDPAIAEHFMTRYERQPEMTRKKFAALVDRQATAQVQEHLLDGDRLPTLRWLYELELTGRISCPVQVLLAEHDQLVPVATARAAWQHLGADVTVVPGQHSLPLTQPDTVAEWVQRYG